MAQSSADQAAFEAACQQMSSTDTAAREEARRFLQEFRTSPQALVIGRGVLGASMAIVDVSVC